MPPHEDGTSVWVSFHCTFQTACEILFKWRILNDRYLKGVMKPEHSLTWTLRDSLDLLDVANLKARLPAMKLLNQQCHKNCPLRMGVNATVGSSFKCCQEQWRTCRWFQIKRLADVFARGCRILWSRPREHKHVLWLNELLLHS